MPKSKVDAKTMKLKKIADIVSERVGYKVTVKDVVEALTYYRVVNSIEEQVEFIKNEKAKEERAKTKKTKR